MGLRDMYSAGDIIEYEGGGRDYLVAIEGEEGPVGERLQPVVGRARASRLLR